MDDGREEMDEAVVNCLMPEGRKTLSRKLITYATRINSHTYCSS